MGAKNCFRAGSQAGRLDRRRWPRRARENPKSRAHRGVLTCGRPVKPKHRHRPRDHPFNLRKPATGPPGDRHRETSRACRGADEPPSVCIDTRVVRRAAWKGIGETCAGERGLIRRSGEGVTLVPKLRHHANVAPLRGVADYRRSSSVEPRLRLTELLMPIRR